MVAMKADSLRQYESQKSLNANDSENGSMEELSISVTLANPLNAFC
jgi:hypothetical protein